MASSSRRRNTFMENNPYAAPDSELAVETTGSASQRFYVVSPAKFLLLYFGTLGMYDLYWVYKHGAQFKRATKGDQWPVMRTLFPIFFISSLTEEIEHSLRRNGVKHSWSAGLFAGIVIIMMISGRVFDRLAYAEIGSPVTDFLPFLTLVVSGYFQYRIQCAANSACGDPEGISNKNFTAANFIWLGLGSLLWLLSLAGLFLVLNPEAFVE